MNLHIRMSEEDIKVMRFSDKVAELLEKKDLRINFRAAMHRVLQGGNWRFYGKVASELAKRSCVRRGTSFPGQKSVSTPSALQTRQEVTSASTTPQQLSLNIQLPTRYF